MRKSLAILVVAVMVAAAMPSYAELQNVLVGGSIQIRGAWTSNEGVGDSLNARNPLFQSPWTGSWKWAGGDPQQNDRWAKQPGRLAITSPLSWNDKNNSLWDTQQRTKLNVRADFTEQVSAFIELDAYNIWGTNFRSNYLTGVDSAGTADVKLYQAYIEAKEMFGQPIRLRVGRQELVLGSGWLVGNNSAGPVFTGLSFDAVRATYATDQFSVDAFWAKLVETSPLEGDGDVDLTGVYASYLGVENMSFDAYWLWVRDARSLTDTNLGVFGEWIEDLFNVDNYNVTNIHTVGLRGAGTYSAIDFEAEVAYQFGEGSVYGKQFAGAGLLSPYGENQPNLGQLAAHGDVGYTFDIDMHPRVWVGGAYLGGDDKRALNFWQWLGAVACPFYHEQASASFNRLFSNTRYSNFLDVDGSLSNVWLVRGGVSATPLENVKVDLKATYFQTLEAYRTTWPIWWICGNRVLPLYPFSFVDQPTPKDLGIELTASATYNYSEDLSFQLGFSHMFVMDGLSKGNFNLNNGLGFDGGTAPNRNKDADYVWIETKLAF